MTDKPLKILLTDPHLKGGGQVRYVTNLAAQLTAMGHDVAIGCKPGSVLVDRAADAGCAALDRFAFRGGLRPHLWARDLGGMRGYLHAEQPDIVHVSGSQDHWVSALANRMAGRPACLVRTRHNTYPVKDGLPNRVLNQSWTDYQIVVCDVVRKRLAQQRAFDGERMTTIHNGVDAEAYQPDPAARAAMRDVFGYRDYHLVLGIAARLVPAKGHTYLFQALAMLKDTYPSLRLLVMGDGGLRDYLETHAVECGVGDRVLFTGFRDDMPQCVQAIDIGVQPSIDCDTSSFSLKEQMAAGKPVIASDYGGLTEIVEDGVEGLVVPAGTVGPLAHALETLAENPERRAAMGENGRQRVLRDFDVEVFAQRTLNAYAEALKVHRARQNARHGVTGQA